MRAAPAVDHPIARDGFWRHACSALAGAAAAVSAAWACSLGWNEGADLLTALLAPLLIPGLQPMSRPAATAATLLAVLAAGWAGGRAGRCASRVAAASLRWDGGQWSLLAALPRSGAAPAEEVGTPQIALDWGDWLLLRWQAPGRRSAWLPLRRADHPARWHLLRVALRQATTTPPPPVSSGPAARAAP